MHEFFQGFVNHAQVTLHVDNLRGDNAHHQAETVFKAFGRALRMAVEADPRVKDVPSTKGKPVECRVSSDSSLQPAAYDSASCLTHHSSLVN